MILLSRVILGSLIGGAKVSIAFRLTRPLGPLSRGHE